MTFSILAEPFFIRALLAGLGLAVITGPIGCFVVWRRMAYFGETLAHAGLMGVGLGLLFNFNVAIGAMASSLLVALLLIGLKRQNQVATDTLLGILSHTALAIGVIVIGLVTGAVTGHLDILFGDVLTVSRVDVITIWIGTAGVFSILAYLWRDLIAISVHEDLARAEGVNVPWVELVFLVTMAAVTAFAMKIVGLLLITALTVIPAAAARRLAASPEGMAIWSAVIAAFAVAAGLVMSALFGTIAGPSIVLAASFVFVLTLLKAQRN
ncbi:MAG: metal ABC transporter permease [Alphaproteobacteria bacterium]|nr:metal ABC transporter permease [Alphaproteobacteria bacterium]